MTQSQINTGSIQDI